MQALNILIATTASIPWFTGTSINPLQRALELKSRGHKVTLLLPWVPPENQNKIYAKNRFQSQEDQKQYIFRYIKEVLKKETTITIRFYQSRYFPFLGSIFPQSCLIKELSGFDWVLLEEPEHLFFLKKISKKEIASQKVTGVLHTNYLFYLKNKYSYLPWVKFLSASLIKKYVVNKLDNVCDEIIAINDPVSYGKFPVIRINGVGDHFFTPLQKPGKRFFYMGKLIKEKNIDKIIHTIKRQPLPLDIIGTGTYSERLTHLSRNMPNLRVFSQVENVPNFLKDHKALFNPSISEVHCTTTMEALAMNKFVILPSDPSNDCFKQYKNSLIYQNEAEMLACLDYALHHEPVYDEQVEALRWRHTTDNLLACSKIEIL